jgi:hypothetical protein
MTARIIPFSPTSQDTPEPHWASILKDPDDQIAAAEYWHLTTAEMRQAGTYAQVNAPQIKRYVIALVMFDRQTAALMDEGPILIGKRTKLGFHSPRWTVYKDLDTQANAHEDRLGLTPRRRAQVTPAKKAKIGTTADRLLSGV